MNDAAKVRVQALKFLSRREYSAKQMVDKLVGKGADLEVAYSVVADLSDAGIMSDERYAKEWLRVRMRQGYGPKKIEFELKRSGVAEHVICDCLNANDPIWTDRLQLVVERKYANQAVDSFKEWARRANQLRNRGYTATQIERVLGRYDGSG